VEETQQKTTINIEYLSESKIKRLFEDFSMLNLTNDRTLMNFFAREMVTPRLNLLCDLCRLTVETLRHNVRLIHIYAKVKKWSYDFCIKYENRNEFHRIFETSQRHLVELINLLLFVKSKVLERPNLTSLDTTLAYMVTRADQLKVACKFRMWSIAFS